MAKKRVKVKTDSLKVGHQLMTPADSLPYRIVSLSTNYVYNDRRERYEKQATCVWLDNGCTFQTYFPRRGFYTLVDR